ncbi:FMN-binding negative transcriptional regulator [Mangrovimonas sp. DI 80]|uniref:FMN-binding negative transcriptional regulator n=1 Tax=Mangrovimonas sp. DI 80 TaxID=1779330 RepID=UPI0009775845|nr:FMN-binding negative transcriptional regulator [Mangrovimonas sp. DI 80]OMP30247.1 transcriptional regulator [Mangrovimonas sp. DI 80]
MAYPPKTYQDSSLPHLLEVVKEYPLATVISVENNRPIVTHIPLVYKESKLIGHLDKQNPQAELLKNNQPVTAIFSGPQAYISPSNFESEQLPTWNYIFVHIQGNAIEISDANAIKDSMVAMTHFLEAPDHKYILEQDNPRMEQLINYVSGFEIDITHWEGKFKLSQDKPHQEFVQAKEALITENQKSIQEFLGKIL